ncbi:vacuolar protein sorting 55 [Anaeromyces robustus]|uniref:Vacuolar protein sorting 55 n=1 Tax=Anaeromyces robustus TaxID=1754192 RepID=A0A1Y1WRF5_9FUNG|nr:vacuolar protein sorting 55 [Anaeromyces robustus]|eukprot:ORX76110.1 vacuolar protein sorting 55 [Anaeromyces robustus]
MNNNNNNNNFKSNAFFFAIGVLLIILSCALESNWWSLFVVLTYAIAPLPNIICSNLSYEDFSDGSSSNEVGYFFTSIFIISGFGIPAVLTHIGVITTLSATLSIVGGLMVYGTIIGYRFFFSRRYEYDSIY